jgi:Ca-activated chloride channel homolog
MSARLPLSCLSSLALLSACLSTEPQPAVFERSAHAAKGEAQAKERAEALAPAPSAPLGPREAVASKASLPEPALLALLSDRAQGGLGLEASAGLGLRGSGASGGGLGRASGSVDGLGQSVFGATARKKTPRASRTSRPSPLDHDSRPALEGPAGGTFVHAGVNPFTKTSEDRFSTFSIDVDTGSYTFARRSLEEGARPPAASVRVEEWVNAFPYSYEGPGEGAPFAVHLAGAPSPFTQGRHLLRVGVQGKRLTSSERKPLALTFLVDISGSMGRPDRLPLAQRSLHLLADQLDERDAVSLVTYAGGTGEVLGVTRATKSGKVKIHRAIDALRIGGGTNMGSGMELAYQNAGKVLTGENVSRVIVLSDGDANIGRTSHQEILKAIKGYVSEGVTLSTVGFGNGNYNDHLMEQLANAGDGNYAYIDSIAAAKKAFVTDLLGTMQVIAKDVKIQVELNPEVVKSYRLVGYENRDIADKDFRNDKVDAGEIGAGHTVTALYEVELHEARSAPAALATLATVRIRHKAPRGEVATEIARTLAGRHLHERFSDLDDDTRFAAATALAAEVLRGSEHVAHLSLADARALAAEALGGPFAEERKELVRLLDKVSEERSLAAVR